MQAACTPSHTSVATDTLYVMAGVRATFADLYEMRLPLQFRLLARHARISSLAAMKTSVVVADARVDVDRLEVWDGCRLGPVPGLGSPHAFTPAISPSGVLAYVELEGSTGALSFSLKTWDPASQRGRVILSNPTSLGDPCWNLDGSLRILRSPGNGTTVLTVTSNGTIVGPDLAADATLDMKCSIDGIIALLPRRPEARSTFVDPKTGRRTELLGWTVLAWSPDGRRVLVQAADGTLGILRWPVSGPVQRLGRSPVSTIWDAGWAR
jgi:hypothetical protein